MNAFQRRRRALMMQAAAAPAPVHGTWEDLFAKIADGTYATAYSVGEILPLDLGTEGAVNAQIVAFNADSKADNSGKAKVSIVSQYMLNTSVRWNPALAGTSGNRTIGTGTIGGWEYCEMREHLRDTILPMIPANVRNRIVNVTKYSRTYSTAEVVDKETASTENIWLPSVREVFGTGTIAQGFAETQGVIYSDVFKNATSRTKSKVGVASASCVLRTAGNTTKCCNITNVGNCSSYNVNQNWSFAIGFCID